ncbi:MAG: phosphonate ABC transporter, permease protein PhnE [Pseudomonadota bacterium]
MSLSESSVSGASNRRSWKRPPFIKNPLLRWGLTIGAALYLSVALGTMEVNWARVYEGLDRGLAFVAAFTSPDFSSRAGDIWEGMLESLIMTVTSTVIGILISVPIGLGAARNIAPPIVYLICRGIIALSRALQEIIVAILMVAIFGFGPLAGVITLAFATIGFLAKLLAEDIEDMSPSQAEAIRATGAGWLQWINYGVQPQVMPRLIGLSLYRLDINFRESAILGLVGAGGIGATLNTAFDRYEFDTAAAILLIIIGIVMVVEYSSGLIRARLQ